MALCSSSRFVTILTEDQPVKDRLRKAKGRIRTMKANSLAYALVDTIVDRYFIVLEKLG
jgi:magnesium transporter